MGGIIDTITGKSGERAATAATDAAALTAEGQEQALEYLKEREEVPQFYREQALDQYAQMFGLPGFQSMSGVPGTRTPATGARDYPTFDPDQAQLIEQARSSPLYASIMGTQKAGEDAILRGASATGGLRSGNTQHALFDTIQRLEERALLGSYNEQLGLEKDRYLSDVSAEEAYRTGLRGLGSLPSNVNQIAGAIAAPGASRGLGRAAAGQAEQMSDAFLTQATFDLVGEIFGGQGGAMFKGCDSRLKTNVKPAGERSGHNWYTWEWNEKAAEVFGLTGKDEGVMAHEVAKKVPEAVGVTKSGYLVVDYARLT